MLHIGLYTPAWPIEDFQNGIVTYVKHMRDGLAALGHRVSIVTARLGPSSRDADVHVVREEWSWRLHAAVARRAGLPLTTHYGRAIATTFRQIHKKNALDLIEIEESFGWCEHVRKLGIPTVVKLHGPAFLSLVEEELLHAGAQAKIEAEGRALARARLITSPSVHTLQDTVKRFNLAAKTAHARNPLDASVFPVWNRSLADPDTVLFVGRFDKRKGGDIVLQAFKRVLQSKPSAKLIFVGPDRGLTQADGSVQRFDAYARSLFDDRELQRVSYRGPLAPSAVERLRLEAWVTLIASRWENAAYTAAEALAQGCPVAAIDGNVREVVIDDQTGLIADDAETLASAILELMQDAEKAARLGAAARQFIVDTHSPSVAVRVAERIYIELLERARV